MNTLYYGDNLKILREYIKDETVDLIYLDPPFNSNRNYNVLFRDESGADSDSQITAFEDTWHWNHTAEETYHELILAGDDVSKMIESFRSFIGTNQMMAYLVMMAVRLKELHRVLKPTGSLYLHCDPTASHYLKILLDTIFGAEHFRNEIIWKRYGAHNDSGQGSKHFGRVHDVILFFVKSEVAKWNQVFTELNPDYVKTTYRYVDEKSGRKFRVTPLTAPGGAAKGNPEFEWNGHTRFWRYSRDTMQRLHDEGKLYYSKTGYAGQKLFLEDSKGTPVQDSWSDVPSLTGANAERLGYPTQKPVALLERIVAASSNEGDVVLDPFCGCGTTIAAAQKLNRQWIGIDITHLSIALQKYRLKDAFGLEPVGTRTPSSAVQSPPAIQHDTTGLGGNDQLRTGASAFPFYRIIGEPEDLDGARQLATEDRYQFQWWALSLIKARPLGGNAQDKTGKKGADKGIDGTITFIDEQGGKAKRVIVSVKSGHLNVAHIRDLGHVIDREQAAIGVYLTLEPPTRPMLTEALEKGFYHSPGWNRDYPRLQIVTVEDLLNGKAIEMPQTSITFKQAERIESADKNQNTLRFTE